jgi:hypothetical protein
MERLASADQSSTLVVPVDAAVIAMPYKPCVPPFPPVSARPCSPLAIWVSPRHLLLLTTASLGPAISMLVSPMHFRHQAPSPSPALQAEGSAVDTLAAEELRSQSNAQRWVEGYVIAVRLPSGSVDTWFGRT